MRGSPFSKTNLVRNSNFDSQPGIQLFPEMLQDSQALPPGQKQFLRVGTGNMGIVLRDHRIGFPAVFSRCHAVGLLEGLGKIAVIGKAGLHTDGDHGQLPFRDELAGVAEPNRVHIVLKGLIHGIADEMGEVADRAALGLSKVCQSDLLPKVFFHILGKAHKPGVFQAFAGGLL